MTSLFEYGLSWGIVGVLAVTLWRLVLYVIKQNKETADLSNRYRDEVNMLKIAVENNTEALRALYTMITKEDYKNAQNKR